MSLTPQRSEPVASPWRDCCCGKTTIRSAAVVLVMDLPGWAAHTPLTPPLPITCCLNDSVQPWEKRKNPHVSVGVHIVEVGLWMFAYLFRKEK